MGVVAKTLYRNRGLSTKFEDNIHDRRGLSSGLPAALKLEEGLEEVATSIPNGWTAMESLYRDR